MNTPTHSVFELKDGTYFKGLGLDKCIQKTMNYVEAKNYNGLPNSIVLEDCRVLIALNQEPNLIDCGMVNTQFTVFNKINLSFFLTSNHTRRGAGL